MQGPQGNQGPIGPQGINGTAGSSGVQGPTGPQGVNGSNGAQGSQGPQGVNGSNGAQGSQGPQGVNGSNGAQGSQGPTGPQGNQGANGTSGTNGTGGTSGINGTSGTNGSQGNQGPTGFQGNQGNQGPTGPQGNQGNQGATGPQGNQGPHGNQGGNGTSGVNGTSGTTGSQGNQGATGSQGNQGVNGTNGTSGFSIVSGSFATTSSLEIVSASAWGAFQSASSYSSSLQTSISASNYTITINSASLSSLSSSFNTRVSALATYTSSMNTWTSSLSAIGTLNTDYIHAGRITSEQVGVGAGSDVIFNSTVVSSGISMNTSTGVFTLTANKTYRLFGSVGFINFSSATGWFVYQWVDATTNTALDTTGISVGVAEALNRDVSEFNATSANLIYTPSTNQTIKLRITDGNGTTTIRSSIGTKATIEQINPSVALNQFATLQISGSLSVTGSLVVNSGITGQINATNGVISGSTQLTTSFPSKTTGTWSVPAGASTQSFTVESGHSYSMWVNGNIPNGIITWNATVTTSNTNVPAVGSQYGWYYTPGNALVLTTIPDQIIGTNGSIANIPTSYAPNTSNVFKFGITNNSGTTQTINYGYIKLS